MITQEELKKALHYDLHTGAWTWLIRPANCIKIGDAAGHMHRGYHKITIGGREYIGSRLAWLYMTGEWPVALIDHRDLNPSNGKWENLREATYSQNGSNRTLMANNKSGFKGVSWFKQTKKWRADIRVERKLIYLGSFQTPEAAHLAYAAAAQKYHGEFARAA